MAIVVENGSVVAGANSYASVATVDAYHTALGQSTWTGDDADKETAILRAMRYIENLSWNGKKTAQTNPLSWPRYDTYDRDDIEYASNIVPTAVVNALCEAALVEIANAGALRPTQTTEGQVKRQKIDVIETEYFESNYSRQSFDAIDNELTGLVGGSGGNSVKVVRA